VPGRARGFLSGAGEIDDATVDVRGAPPGGVDDDDGVLLVPTLADTDETTVIGVVDARSMECLAQLRTPQIVPFGFHAAFKPMH